MEITLREVAKEAGVSIATVSHVLTQHPGARVSPSTRERVLRAARQLDYRHNALAADLARGSTRMVGIHVSAVGVPMLEQKLRALEQGLRDAGFYPLLCHAIDLDAEQTFFKECASRRFCGAVLMNPPLLASHGELRRLMDQGTVVVSAEPVPELGLPCITVDRGAGAEAAVQHLLSLGHRRIAAIQGFGGHAGHDFCEGYRRGMQSRGVPFDPALLLPLDADARRSCFERGERTIERVLGLVSRPTAVMTTDDEVAIGVLGSLRRRGLRVPEDVAVVGYDDLPVAAYAEPPLTTVAQPAEAVGTQLAQLFLDGVNDRQQIAGRHRALPPRLVIRESCGAALRLTTPDQPQGT
jgi:DNA-binding LacI/PurR family transcriptional regulator